MNLFSLQLSYLLSALAHPKGTKDGLPDSYTMDASSSAKCAISCTNSPRAELGKERKEESNIPRARKVLNQLQVSGLLELNY